MPGRDEKWREETIRATSEEQFRQEFETEFLVGEKDREINRLREEFYKEKESLIE